MAAASVAPMALSRAGLFATGVAIAFCGLATAFLQHSCCDGILPHSPAILLQQARSCGVSSAGAAQRSVGTANQTNSKTNVAAEWHCAMPECYRFFVWSGKGSAVASRQPLNPIELQQLLKPAVVHQRRSV